MSTNSNVNLATSNNTSDKASEPLSTPEHAIKLNRLLQLCSANLPVGGFSFSQGLEYAIEAGWIKSQADTASWIQLNLSQSIAQTDLAILKRSYQALATNDLDKAEYWNQHIIACRESYELQLADLAMGKALIRLLKNLTAIDCEPYQAITSLTEISFVSAFALAAVLFELDLASAQSGYCWTYIDNQVAAATKLVPLGQTQAQNLLFNLTADITEPLSTANNIADHEIGASLPHLAMASAWHETQYSRLFRS
ncbi:MAG: urease accessory protein UreF [Thalassotalea sp.]